MIKKEFPQWLKIGMVATVIIALWLLGTIGVDLLYPK